MGSLNEDEVRSRLDVIYRSESRRIFATLVRLLRDFDLAEEAMHEAFATAVGQWTRDGIPDNPRAWLVSTGRFKAIDSLRKRARFDAAMPSINERSEKLAAASKHQIDTVEDDQLRLIFTCCHPAIAPESQLALTLREVCGLSTEAIASAFLIPVPTLAQRIVRAKAKIREAGIPYEVPTLEDLPERLEVVLHVIYLVFNEGYSATSGDSLIRADLSNEAIRLGRLLYQLMPDSEVTGLLALMLLHESRRLARTNSQGELILLEDQDRTMWDQQLIEEGKVLVEKSLRTRRIGPYTLQAAISAVHAQAKEAADTDWSQIVGLYNVLFQLDPSPIVELNRAVAVAMQSGPREGLILIDSILQRGELEDYYLAHSARAELCRRLQLADEARCSYLRALELVNQDAEKRFLMSRLDSLG